MKEIRSNILKAADPAGDNAFILEGMAIVFNQPTLINDGGYNEVILPGALDGCSMDDCRLLFNHDTNRVPLAKTPNTMSLELSPAGLKMRATLPNTADGQAVYESVKRGDTSGLSFAFTVSEGGSSYDARSNLRTISKIAKIYELSITPWPCYGSTSVEARSQITEAKVKAAQIERANLKIKMILGGF